MWIIYALLTVPVVCLFCLLLAVRLYLTRAVPCQSGNRLTGRKVVITGAGSGIGLVTARECSRRGATVIVTCRNKLRADRIASDIINETLNESVFGMQLDLSSFTSVERFFRSYIDTFKDIDILINNAAYMGPTEITEDGFDKSLQINYLSHFYLTYLFNSYNQNKGHLKYLRVINVTSSTHTVMDAINALKNKLKAILRVEQSRNMSDMNDNHKAVDSKYSPESTATLAAIWRKISSDEVNRFHGCTDWIEVNSLEEYSSYAVTKFFLQLFSFELHKRYNKDSQEMAKRNLDTIKQNLGVEEQNCQTVESNLENIKKNPYSLEHDLKVAPQISEPVDQNTAAVRLNSASTNTKTEVMFENQRAYKQSIKEQNISLDEQQSSIYDRYLIVLSVNPGPTRTGLQRHLKGIFGKFVRLIALLLFRSPEQGAQSVIYCSVIDDDDAFRLSGAFITDCAEDLSLKNRLGELEDCGICVWDRAERLCEQRIKLIGR